MKVSNEKGRYIIIVQDLTNDKDYIYLKGEHWSRRDEEGYGVNKYNLEELDKWGCFLS